MTTTAGTYLFLPVGNLRLHPRNLRRIYNKDSLERLAVIIKRTGGLLQAMLIILDAESGNGDYLVVDGNRRLRAARILGDACPPLKCEVIGADQAEQMLIMLATAMH